MTTNSKQIQALWQEHTGGKIPKDFAEMVAGYIGNSETRLEVVTSLMRRAGGHKFQSDTEQGLYFSRLVFDHHFADPIPAPFTKVPAGSSFATSHDRKLRSASQIIEEFIDRPWHRGVRTATVNFIERVGADPDAYWDAAVRFYDEAYPVGEDVETFISDKGLHSTHGEAAAFVASLQRSGSGLNSQAGV